LFKSPEFRKGDSFPAALFPFGSKEESSACDLFLAAILRDSIGFAGCKMIRRIVGIAHVEDLESISDLSARASCEIKVLEMARELIIHREKFLSSDLLVTEVINLARRA